MITDRKTLQMYLDADKFALGIKRIIPIPFLDRVWRYERLLRYYEYHKNVGHKILRLLCAIQLQRLGDKLGFSISGNVFGPGLRINHFGLLVVNAKAKVGKWCDIHQGVNIGENGYYADNGDTISQVPTIGDFCFIGPGAKLFGAVTIGDNVRIGANSVVNKSVENDMVVYGVDKLSIKPYNRNLITIASIDTEQAFLEKYPQYKGMI